MKARVPRCLTIAGSDSGGGAGLQADLKTFAAFGCFGASAVTAITAQNTCGVKGIWELPAECVVEQISAVLQDIGADAVKIGMLQRVEIVRAVAATLPLTSTIPIVLDPVMVAKGGAPLLHPDAVEAIKLELLPRVTVVTPNLPEVQALLGTLPTHRNAIEEAAREIAAFGTPYVVIKGGHGSGDRCDDLLYLAREERFLWLEAPRIATHNTHGTGCTFSAAIAASLAHGRSVEDSVIRARNFLLEALGRGRGFKFGAGHGPALVAIDTGESE